MPQGAAAPGFRPAMSKNRCISCHDACKREFRGVLKELFGSARGVEEKEPDTRHSADPKVREICADDLRWDGRLSAPLSRHHLFQARPIKLVRRDITPETEMRKQK